MFDQGSCACVCAQGDILEDIALIENLEETKRTALDIADKVVQARDTGEKLGRAREVYRCAVLTQ